MKKEILIICATHGNERIGLEIIEKLKEKKLCPYFDYMMANPKALRKNIRFLDCDLNRSYPGNKKSKLYEKRRASEILEVARKYKYVIDVHEASSGINDFIIAPRKKVYKIFPIGLIDIRIVLLWPEPKGSLGSLLKNTVEFEFGMKGRKRKIVVKDAIRIVEKFINNIRLEKTGKSLENKKFYYVYGSLSAKDPRSKINLLKDFKKFIGREKFYPLLVGQYVDEGIACYKMKRIMCSGAAFL